MKIIEKFSTSDLVLATALSLKFPLETIQKVDQNKFAFIFDNTDILSDFVEKFWKGETKVDPLKFSNNRKIIMSRICGGGSNGK